MPRRLLAFLTTLVVILGLSPVRADAAPPVTTIEVPLPTGPNPSELVASADGRYLFADGSVYDDSGLVTVVAGVATAQVHEFDGTAVALTRGSGASTTAVRVQVATGEEIVVGTGGQVTAVGLSGWVRERQFHTWLGDVWALPAESLPVAQSGGVLVSFYNSVAGVIDIATQEFRPLGRASHVQAGPGGVLYAALGSLTLCSWNWGDDEPTCSPGSFAGAGVAQFLGNGTALHAGYAETPRRLRDMKALVGGTWRPVEPPAGTILTSCMSGDDVLCTATGAAGRTVVRLLDSGAWAAVLDLPSEPVTIRSLALTPTALVGSDDRDVSTTGGGAWHRTLATGATERLGASGTVWATGSRVLVDNQWFDGAVAGPMAVQHKSDETRRVSGTYVLSERGAELVNHNGVNLLRGTGLKGVDVFGGNLLTANTLYSGLEAGGVPVWQDLKLTTQRTWGPWLAGRDAEPGRGVVLNWRTGDRATFDTSQHGAVWDLGDGILVTRHADSGTISIFNISSLRAGTLSPAFTFDGVPHSIERNRLAWTTPSGQLRISTFPFGGTSTPMVEGRAGEDLYRSTTQPWSPSFDLTAPVTPGTLTIRTRAGAVVRTIAVPASADGSIRLSWDMRDSSGRAVSNGAYAWELDVRDSAGRKAVPATMTGAVAGVLTVGPAIKVTPPAPTLVIGCGKTDAVLNLPPTHGVLWSSSTRTDSMDLPVSATVTAVAEPGYVLTGPTTWELAVARQSCDTLVPAPTFVDPSGSQKDRLIIPTARIDVDYLVDGVLLRAGEHRVSPGSTIVVTTRFPDGGAPQTWRHTYSAAGPEDPYTTTGEHLINGRRWRTTCEPYSITTRCRTEIWATTTSEVNGRFVSANGWVFNNLTYLPSPRAAWANNPLGHTVSWTATDGRRWRTECDTPRTGGNGCRSEAEVRMVAATAKPGGGYSYRWDTRWVLNNIVQFK